MMLTTPLRSRRRNRRSLQVCAAALAAAGTLGFPAAHAATITDETGVFLQTFSGPHNSDLDVQSIRVTYDADNIFLNATMAGDIGQTAGAVYVWGVNTGGGRALLTEISNPIGEGVTFNSVVAIGSGAPNAVLHFGLGGLPAGPIGVDGLAAGAVTISGRTINAVVPRAFLPSTGLDISEYGFNLWPRTGLQRNDQVADFAPNASTVHAAAVPEPASWAIMITGFGLAGATLRRRRRLQLA